MISYLKKEKVLDISIILAVISSFFVHPDQKYLDYVDVRVLALLFCLMLLVKGFQDIGLLDIFIYKLFGNVRSSRVMFQILIAICFFFSMVMTNDVALITFVPFAVEALLLCGQQKQLITVVVMQTMAANLGSMFTPIGNPQNLYLFSVSGMSTEEFFAAMLPITLASFLMLLVASYLLPNEKIELRVKNDSAEGTGMNRQELLIYVGLFVLNLFVVFRVLSWVPALLITIAVIMGIKKSYLFKKVDYALLMTFVGFFIFVGNLGRISYISRMIERILNGREIVMSAAFSQFLSNVPAAILLSGFTDHFQGLLVGTNIGGLGTLIASMASLISYKLYAASEGSNKGKYMLIFTFYNVVGLVILLLVAKICY